MSQQASMPQDWNNHSGWEDYYQGKTEEDVFADTFSHSNVAVQYLGYFLHKNYSKIWFPGCGVSLAPHVYQRLGFKVWASDVSSSAIGIQKKLSPKCFSLKTIKGIIDSILQEQDFIASNELHFKVQDFLTSYPEESMDCIVNVRSFQGLPSLSMEKAAVTHYQALKPGGVAMFETINVQGERRNILEDSLRQAGFYIPFSKAERWYRKVLDGTDIPYIFILGNPIIPGYAEGYNGFFGKRRLKKDTEKLRSFAGEYEKRYKEESEEVNAKEEDGVTKIAHVVYNTG